MCGFAGFISNQSKILEHLESNVTRMASTISSRGPDDFGAWGEKYFGGPNQSPFTFTSAVGLDTTSHFGVALGFRRLAVIELSNAGHQPMTSPSGRYVITFNGEIYNHLSLRALLSDKVTWKGHSDTETLLACIEYFGLKETLQKTIGMFAIALWDKELKTLYLIFRFCLPVQQVQVRQLPVIKLLKEPIVIFILSIWKKNTFL
jgi:asparagine synthase (glutamine-hydrolysing)